MTAAITLTTVRICKHEHPCHCITSRRYDESKIDTVYLGRACIAYKDRQHKEMFTCSKSHSGHVLRLLKRDDGTLGFVCEYNHYVKALETKDIVGLDKPHGGWLTEESIRLREQRDAESRELFARALRGS